jgi:aminoglycoside phosphotransferase (APT) family kinase protein
VIEKFSSGKPTLVHGSYRPRNIIVDTSATDVRICPADWELTGIGPPLHDFAFLADGADRSWIESMWESYVAAAADVGLTVVQPDDLIEEIGGLRLHKALRSLARSADWDYPADMVTKIVAKAEMIGRDLR